MRVLAPSPSGFKTVPPSGCKSVSTNPARSQQWLSPSLIYEYWSGQLCGQKHAGFTALPVICSPQPSKGIKIIQMTWDLKKFFENKFPWYCWIESSLSLHRIRVMFWYGSKLENAKGSSLWHRLWGYVQILCQLDSWKQFSQWVPEEARFFAFSGASSQTIYYSRKLGEHLLLTWSWT
jgi:hypothetical protein